MSDHKHNALVIVPTYNERDNLPGIVEALGKLSVDLLVVDDNSPDGTSDVVRRIARTSRHVRIVQRVGRRGLSSAVIEGVLATAAPVIAVMDGDLQHSEDALPRLIDAVATADADIAVGTRYVDGGGVGEWSALRVSMSQFATKIGQIALRTKVSDPMSGFFAMRREAFDAALPRLSAIGFKILADILASLPTPLRVAEVPYQFRTREAGESKIGARVIAEYAELLAEKTIGRFVPVRLLKFALLTAGNSFMMAQTGAVVTAIAFNFFLNNSFTYADRKLKGWAVLGGLASFYAISAVGALANIGIGTWLAGQNERWWVAGVAGVLVGAIWNFAMSSALTWRK